MTSHVYDYYRMKSHCLPAGIQYAGLYIKPGQVPLHIMPDEWTLVGSAHHPSPLTIADVETHGYCERQLPLWIDAKRFYSRPANF